MDPQINPTADLAHTIWLADLNLTPERAAVIAEAVERHYRLRAPVEADRLREYLEG
jgi:hypothetical protein